MRRKETTTFINEKFLRVFGAGILFVSLTAVFAGAFTSVEKQTITMEVTIADSGIIIGDLSFDFVPIQGISPADNIVILQGGVGNTPKGIKPGFQSPLTQSVKKANSESGSSYIPGPADSPIHVLLKYRFIGIDESTDSVSWKELGGPAMPVSSTAGVNASFGFQIDPAEVKANTGKELQYYFIAQQFDNGNLVKTILGTPKGLPYYRVMVAPSRAPEVLEAQQPKRIIIPQGNPNVGNSSMEIPLGVLKNKTSIGISDLPLDLVPQALKEKLPSMVSAYRVDATPDANGPYKFTLLYPDFTFPVGQAGLLGASNVSEQNAVIFGWDGLQWKKLGGKVDAGNNTISVNSSYYQYLAVGPGLLTPLESRPSQKIITPNGDGKNDGAIFNLPTEAEVNIFDSSMHKIRAISGLGTGVDTIWDGRDDDGKVVESGAYIYQFKVDGELVSGVIGVAK